MNNDYLYKADGFVACKKCSWTGPDKYFDEIPALLPHLKQLRCPHCGFLNESAVNTFEPSNYKLPDNFKIVSGGQTGVDQGALDAAIKLNIPHSGWCPCGRKCEDGIIPDKYNLKEMSYGSYSHRTEQNVIDSDGTLVFPANWQSKGTNLTIRLAKKHNKPLAVIPLDAPDSEKTMIMWLGITKIQILNVAGPRESGAKGIYLSTFDFLTHALEKYKL